MNSAEFESQLHTVLAKQFRFSVLPNVRLFRPSYAEKRRYGFEMDNLMHIAFEGSDYIIVIEAKNQPVLEVNGMWQVTYEGGPKCARRQLREHIATLKEYVTPLARNVDLRFLGIVVSSDSKTIAKTLRINESEEYYCRFYEDLPELLSTRFNLRKAPTRGIPEVLRLSQSSFLELFRLGVPLEFLGHPEINSAIRYVERCRRSIDETIFHHFSPTPERWAINGSAGMGKSVLLGYAACVLACGFELEQAEGKSRLRSAEDRLADIKFDPTKGSLGVFAMTQRQLDNLRGWFDHFTFIFRALDVDDKVRFRRPEFHLCRTMTELEQRPWAAVLLDEAHDLEENVAKRLVFRHKADGFYLMLACDRHQKLRLTGDDSRIIEGLVFSSHTKRLRQIYRNPSSVYIASLALMFRWFAEVGPKILPTKEELEGGFGFEVQGSIDEGYSAALVNDAHPANGWSHTVGSFPSAAAAFNSLAQAKLGRAEVLWVRFSGEDRDFDYERLNDFTYHNFRTQEAESLTDKYIKGQDFPVVVIEGFPGFMDRYSPDGAGAEDCAVHEAKMWKFRRELYLCSSRATCFLYFVCTNIGTAETENIQKEIRRLTSTLATPVDQGNSSSKIWRVIVSSTNPADRRKLSVFTDAPVAEDVGASNRTPAEFGVSAFDSMKKGGESLPFGLKIFPPDTMGHPERRTIDSGSPDYAQSERPVYVLNGPITVIEMSKRLEIKPFKIISDLISMKVFVQNAEKTIDETYQERIATKRGYQVRRPTEEENLQQKIVELRNQFGAK
jgi:hypothetical protein